MRDFIPNFFFPHIDVKCWNTSQISDNFFRRYDVLFLKSIKPIIKRWKSMNFKFIRKFISFWVNHLSKNWYISISLKVKLFFIKLHPFLDVQLFSIFIGNSKFFLKAEIMLSLIFYSAPTVDFDFFFLRKCQFRYLYFVFLLWYLLFLQCRMLCAYLI